MTTFAAYLQTTKNQPVQLVVERNGQTVPITATPENENSRWILGFSENPPPYHDQPLAFARRMEKVHGVLR